jgi:hypothetical protein
MNKCTQWKDCKHMSCYHINLHNSHPNCSDHECFLDGAFRKCNCVQDELAEAIAARDKWWIEQIEKHKAGGLGLNELEEGDILLYGWRWQSLKQSLEVNNGK